MKRSSILLALGLMVNPVAFATETLDFLSLNEIAVAQQNANGTYSIVCTNGNREEASAVDVRLGNVCPHNSSSVPTAVLSLQKRNDGQFDVVCRNLSKVVATAAQILNDEICTQSTARVVLDNGSYKASGREDCQITARYANGLLAGLHVSFPGTSSDMTCVGDLCSGVFSGFSGTYQLQILSPTSFLWLTGRAVFNKHN